MHLDGELLMSLTFVSAVTSSSGQEVDGSWRCQPSAGTVSGG